MDSILSKLQLTDVKRFYGIKNLFIHSMVVRVIANDKPFKSKEKIPVENLVKQILLENKKFDGYKMEENVLHVYNKVLNSEGVKKFNHLYVQNKQFSEIGFRFVISLINNEKMIHIHLIDCGINDYMMTFFITCDLTRLKTLVLRGNRMLTNRAISTLVCAKVDLLEFLSVSETGVDEMGVRLVTKCKTFQNLRFFHFIFEGDFFKKIKTRWLARLPNLKRIVCKEEHIDNLSGLKKVKIANFGTMDESSVN